MRSPAISVVIPTLDEEAVIARCLEALAKQTVSREEFEVIVVDNGSHDGTVEAARGFAERLPLRLIERRGVSISGLRNAGAAAAQGRWLAFLDADCLAPQDWLQQALVLLRAPGAGVAGAHYAIPEASSWVARAWYGDMSVRKTGPVAYVPAGTLFIGRDRFFELGGFDESMATSEDCEFCRRASAAGLRVEASAALSVVHLGTPQTVGAFYRKQRWHGTKVHTLFLRNVLDPEGAKSTLFALYTLASTAALAVGVPIALLYGDLAPVAVPGGMLLGAPALIALRAAAQRKKWRLWAPLAFLYLVYGLARGLCLVGLSGARGSRPVVASATQPVSIP
jgi:glycosyltransferase involved in cell wall biosynthesis